VLENDEAAIAPRPACAGNRMRTCGLCDIAAQKQLGPEERGGGRAKEQIAAALVNHLAGLERHIDLAARVVEPHRLRLIDKLAIKVLGTDEVETPSP